MKAEDGRPKAVRSTSAEKAKAPPRKVDRATPIKIMKKDAQMRDLGLQILARFYMGEMDLEMAKRRVLRMEGRTVGDEEAVLALLTEMIRNADDPQIKARLMESVAEYLSALGRDPRPVLAEMHKMELKIFKDLGFERVSIMCKDLACPACRKQNGKVVSIDQALIDMPLPHPGCTKKMGPKASPFCRCKYFGEYKG